MGSLGVVEGDEVIEGALGGGEGGEDLAGEELLTQGAMPALDLAGRGRAARSGQAVGDAVLATDPVKERLGVRLAKAIGEDLAVEFLRNVKSK